MKKGRLEPIEDGLPLAKPGMQIAEALVSGAVRSGDHVTAQVTAEVTAQVARSAANLVRDEDVRGPSRE